MTPNVQYSRCRKEVEKEKKLFDIKMKSLRLDKEYLWNIIKPKKRKSDTRI